MSSTCTHKQTPDGEAPRGYLYQSTAQTTLSDQQKIRRTTPLPWLTPEQQKSTTCNHRRTGWKRTS